VKAVSDKDDRHTEIKQIAADYKAGSINFVDAVYDLRKIGHTPLDAQLLVSEWIKEKHNARDK